MTTLPICAFIHQNLNMKQTFQFVVIIGRDSNFTLDSIGSNVAYSKICKILIKVQFACFSGHSILSFGHYDFDKIKILIGSRLFQYQMIHSETLFVHKTLYVKMHLQRDREFIMSLLTGLVTFTRSDSELKTFNFNRIRLIFSGQVFLDMADNVLDSFQRN